MAETAKKAAKTVKKRNRVSNRIKYRTPGALQKAVDNYFENCNDKPTICGLALGLGFMNRVSLLDYIKKGGKYANVIKKAKGRVEAAYERDLRSSRVSGAIFALKNMGWTDRQDLTLKGDGSQFVIKLQGKPKW